MSGPANVPINPHYRNLFSITLYDQRTQKKKNLMALIEDDNTNTSNGRG